MQPAAHDPADAAVAVRALPREAGPLALVAALLCVGETAIEGLPDDAPTAALRRAAEALGAVVARDGSSLRIRGVGIGGLSDPGAPLHLAGPGGWTLLGALASHDVRARVVLDAGDADRHALLEALAASGAAFAPDGEAWSVAGARDALPLSAEPGTPALAGAVLFAGLGAAGLTSVAVASGTPLPAERVLAAFGADVSGRTEGGLRRVTLRGQPELVPCPITLADDGNCAP